MGRFSIPGRLTGVVLGLMLVVVVSFSAGTAHSAGSYVLGMSAAFTGPSRGLGIELYRGSIAYFHHLNMNGGINGKSIIIETLDDRYQPDPAIQNTIRFMDDPTVRCLFNYVGTPTVTRVLPLLKGYSGASKLLFFPFTGAEPQRRPPYEERVFNLRASYMQEIAELIRRFTEIGLNRVAVFYQADAYGRSGWEGVRRALAARSLTMAGEATYRRGTAFGESMEEQVGILRRSKPDVVISVGSYAACAAFIRDARDMGLDVPIANVSFVGSENMVALLEEYGISIGRDYLDDLVNTQVVPSYEDLTLPAVREYRNFMDTFDPDVPDMADRHYRPLKYSFTSFEGFLNAKVMAAILKRCADKPSARLAEVVESLHHIDLGIGAPVRFGADRHQGLNRVYFTTVACGKFVPMTEEHWARWKK